MITSRKLITGVAVGALALGLFFGQFLKFGIGTGGSVGVTSRPVTAPATSTTRSSPEAKTADIGGVAGDAQHMVLVRIAGSSYSLVEWSGVEASYRSTSLAEIVRLAKAKDGDSRGVKVKISRDETSKAGAEQALRDELRESGIEDGAVEWDGGVRP
jgi:hypothetical protein